MKGSPIRLSTREPSKVPSSRVIRRPIERSTLLEVPTVLDLNLSVWYFWLLNKFIHDDVDHKNENIDRYLIDPTYGTSISRSSNCKIPTPHRLHIALSTWNTDFSSFIDLSHFQIPAIEKQLESEFSAVSFISPSPSDYGLELLKAKDQLTNTWVITTQTIFRSSLNNLSPSSILPLSYFFFDRVRWKKLRVDCQTLRCTLRQNK